MESILDKKTGPVSCFINEDSPDDLQNSYCLNKAIKRDDIDNNNDWMSWGSRA